MDWEIIDKGKGIQRTKVPGGWIVICHTMQYLEMEVPMKEKVGISLPGGRMTEIKKVPVNGMMAMVFVPEVAEQEWIIDKEGK